MQRLWAQIAALGVGQVILTNAERVERDYFDTHVLEPKVFHPLLLEGLQRLQVLLQLSGKHPGRVEQGLLDDALKLAGTYTHHYVICVRKILADDALISMTGGGDEHYYSISLISYARPAERAGFLATSDLLVRSMAKSFGARPHWGKYCPLDRELVRELYPSAGEFAAIARKLDPDGAFRNRWLDDLIFDERTDVAPR